MKEFCAVFFIICPYFLENSKYPLPSPTLYEVFFN